MTFVKGYSQSQEFREKATRARESALGDVVCCICGKKEPKYIDIQKTCKDKKCKREYAKRNYHKLKENDDPVVYRCVSLSGTIRLGKNKRALMAGLLRESLFKPCVYCGENITLENCSVDHKIPRTGSKVHNRKKNKMTYTVEEIKQLDRIENLQIICKSCNRAKGDFSDEQYKKILIFLGDNPDIKELFMKRLRMSMLFFKK